MSGLLCRPEQLEKAAARILLSAVRQHSGSRVLLGVSLRGGAMAGNGKAWTLQPRVCSGTSGLLSPDPYTLLPLQKSWAVPRRPGVGLIWVYPMDHRAVITGFVRTSERSGVPSLTAVNPAQPQQPTLDGALLATCREPLKTSGRSPLL